MILRKYRPVLRLLHIDCAPDGLAACVGLNPDSSVLPARVDAIRRAFSFLRLSEYRLEQLWSLHPVLDPDSFCRDQLGQLSASSR
ncbi:hypothetical protein U8607_17545 [Methylobacterium durans]|uniref:hypothetical protein n=1 Tax=Methylobacterium durans TaxID=2202825 RepID=UPI002AFF22C1|nr:hypothetical protein [Methylobacterium durans]MEA1833894.1 hypothetical protein [Methylobacterium durans]